MGRKAHFLSGALRFQASKASKIALILIMGLSVLFGALPAISGAIQRLLWVVGFAWLVYLDNATASGDGAPRTLRPAINRGHNP